MRDGITWNRGWVQCLIAFALLVGGPAGTALASHTDEQRRSPQDGVWHVSHSVNATVVDNYATVRVGVEIVNEGPDPEFPFRVEIPDDAYVTGLTITRDGETYEAEIQRAQQAREDYEEAKQQGRSAGIVEQDRDTSIYRYDVNVEGRETVEAELTYETYLTAEAGVYTLPLTAPATQRGVDEGASFDVTVRHEAGLEDVWSTPGARVHPAEDGLELSYEVDPRGQDAATDLAVHYEPEATPESGRLVTAVENGTGYFAHRFRSQAQTAEKPVEMSLVLDTSGSMGGEKIAQLKAATRQLVDELNTSDRLHMTFFDHETTTPWEGFRAVDANTSHRALDVVDSLRAGGSTDIESALRDGLAPFGTESQRGGDRLPVVVFLTDGRATDGIEDNERLREIAREANDADAHVFSLAFGANADFELVHGLAEDGDGLAQRIEAGQGAEVDLSSFLTALTSPVLTNVTIDHPNPSVESWRVGAPVVFAGGELLYVGTFDPNATHLNATVQARSQGASQTWNLTETVETGGPTYLPDLVAYQRIQALQDRLDAHGPNASIEETLTGLALEHGFVTQHTSLEVDLPRQTTHEDPEAHADDQDAATGGSGGGGGGGHADAPADTHDDQTSHQTAADSDHDGVPDGQDNCPSRSNPGQNDRDGDGIGNACESNDNRDVDADGVENHADDCPDRAGPASNEGCPRPDHDGDGIADSDDACPAESGPAANDGCPQDSSGTDTNPQHSPSTDENDSSDDQDTGTDQPAETPSVGLVGLLAVLGAAAVVLRRR